VSLLCFSLIDVVVIYAYKVYYRNYTKSDSVTFGILNLFFQACVFASICLVAGMKALDVVPEEDLREEKAEHLNGTDGVEKGVSNGV
jgi:hypothetical protein